MNGRITDTPVSRLFFSQMNIDTLQESIRYLVHKYTGIVIGRQSETNLYMAMYNIYQMTQLESYADYLKVDMVRRLNARVLHVTVRNILQNLDTHNTYLRQRDDWKKFEIGMPIYTSSQRGRDALYSGEHFL